MMIGPGGVAIDRKDVYVAAAVLGAGVLALWIISKRGSVIGQAVGKGAADTVAGAVVGVGSSFGLPNTTDAQVVNEGRAALDAGRYLEASQKLPALEFLNGVGEKLGGWVYDVMHPADNVNAAVVSQAGYWGTTERNF